MAHGVYVHMPFCPYICPYCDFAKEPFRASTAARYIAALLMEIERTPLGAVATIFFGGGTPNTYRAADIEKILLALRKRAVLADDVEISIEVNPDLARCDEFARYREIGITRLSIGAQSFLPEELALLGRGHTPEDVATVVDRARAAGFTNYSIDVMFGLPGQTVADFARSLDAICAIDPPHVSCYGLTFEEGTPFFERRRHEPTFTNDDDREADMYALLIDRLERTGYEQYELSNFARPSFRCRHNENYWANGNYTGFGAGAASFNGVQRSVNLRSIADYAGAIELGRSACAESEELARPDRLGEAVMLALRRREGVDFANFFGRYQTDFLRYYSPIVAQLSHDGMLLVDDRSARLSLQGRFLANTVCAAFIGYGGAE